MSKSMWAATLAVLVSLVAAPGVRAEDDGSTASQAQPTTQPSPSQQAAEDEGKTFSPDEIATEASKFFGETSAGLAKAIERTFSDYGRPNAYIFGSEGSGAIGVGLRYGAGTLQVKDGPSMKVYWQGPTIGWDIGGNASKVFTLVYNLDKTDHLFQRFPAVEGSLYVVAGFGVNYQRSGDIVLAPIRSGVGLRAGANLGYIHYTREKSYIPF